MWTKLKSWCQSSSGTRRCFFPCCCRCCDQSDDKELQYHRGGHRSNNSTSHLEKCQSFYSGLSQGVPTGPLHAPYHTTSNALTGAKKSRTLGGPNGLLTSGLIGSATTRVINLNYIPFAKSRPIYRT